MADSDGDEDEEDDETEDGAQGVGLISRRSNRRVEGDALRYSGAGKGDRGDGTAVRRGGYAYYSEENSDDDDSSEEDDLADAGLAAMSPAERDEVLVQSAFRHIQRAQEKGRADVQLTKDELAALDRRRKRMEEEAARKAARRKARAQRITIPLSQLEPPTRKKKVPSAEDVDEADHVGYPPMGYFPPPKSRPPSGNAGSQPTNANDSRGSSPFTYSYVNSSQPPTRQSSNARTRAARARAQVEESESEESSEDSSSPVHVPGALDPFKYQVSGPRQTRAAAAAASRSRRNPGAADVTYGGSSRNAPSPPDARTAARRRQVTPRGDTDDDTSEEDSDGVEIVSPPRRTRNAAVVAEEERGRRKEKEEKAKKAPSPAAKPSAGPSTRRRRKKK